MQHFTDSPLLRALQIFSQPLAFDGPRRKRLEAPLDRGTFVKPLKQSFIKNPRLMPMTRLVIALLAGWSGHGQPIETTLGIIGKHVGRSARQVQRYMKDAIEEGYLRIAYTKDRIGRITGLRVHLTRMAILHTNRNPREAAEKLATTYPSDTNKKDSYTKGITCRNGGSPSMPTVTQRPNWAENAVTACRGDGLERFERYCSEKAGEANGN